MIQPILLLSLTLLCAQEPDSWPQFKRDAARSGDNPDAALELPLTRTTAVRFPAPIYASPAVVGNRIYIQDARGHVACIDASANKALWTASIGGINNTSSPAVYDGKIYVGSTAGRFFVFESETGRLNREIPAEGGVIAAPAVANGAVYFSTFNGALTKIDLSGQVVWTYDGGRISTTEFAVREKEIIFFAGSDNTVFHHLRDDGATVSVISKTPAPGQCCPVGGPVWVSPNSCVFQSFDSEFGKYFLLELGAMPVKVSVIAGDVNDSRSVASVRGDRIYRGDKCFSTPPKPKLVWRADPQALYDGGSHSSPALARDVMAVGDEQGNVSFFDLRGAETRRKPVWVFKVGHAGQPNGAVSSSPAVVAGRVFFGGENGVLYGLGKGTEAPVVDLSIRDERPAADRLQGSEWRTPGGDMQYSYVSDDAVVKPPFKPQWKTRIWSSFKGPMIVADSRVYGTGRGGPLTALDAATGEILWKVHHPGVESRPSATFVDGKLIMMRVRNGQGDSPYVGGTSGGPPGEGLWCHDAATGKLLWHRPMAFRYHFNPDGLAAHRNKVFVATMDGGQVQIAAFALDTGLEVWRRALTDLAEPVPPAKPGSDVKPIPAGLQLPPRFSGVIAGDLWCVSISDRGTLGVEPDSGNVVWSTKDVFITHRTRVAARGGVLVVFTSKNAEALVASTGKGLWQRPSPTGYAQALTDRYLETKGEKDARPSGRCWWPIFANGIWYSHANASSNNRLIAVGPTEKTIWSHDFLSNACPSPSPAYGRLYYSPCGEGVIYCFASAGE